MTKLEASVRDLISLYVEGYISADALNDGLPSTGEIDEATDEAAELVMRVIGYLAEFQAGDRPEDHLRAVLSDEALWTVGREFSSATGSDPEAQVSVGAGTPLQVVPA